MMSKIYLLLLDFNKKNLSNLIWKALKRLCFFEGLYAFHVALQGAQVHI